MLSGIFGEDNNMILILIVLFLLLSGDGIGDIFGGKGKDHCGGGGIFDDNWIIWIVVIFFFLNNDKGHGFK